MAYLDTFNKIKNYINEANALKALKDGLWNDEKIDITDDAITFKKGYFYLAWYDYTEEKVNESAFKNVEYFLDFLDTQDIELESELDIEIGKHDLTVGYKNKIHTFKEKIANPGYTFAHILLGNPSNESSDSIHLNNSKNFIIQATTDGIKWNNIFSTPDEQKAEEYFDKIDQKIKDGKSIYIEVSFVGPSDPMWIASESIEEEEYEVGGFKINDVVKIKETGRSAIVTDFSIQGPDGVEKIIVLFADNTEDMFSPSELEHVESADEAIPSFKWKLEELENGNRIAESGKVKIISFKDNVDQNKGGYGTIQIGNHKEEGYLPNLLYKYHSELTFSNLSTFGLVDWLSYSPFYSSEELKKKINQDIDVLTSATTDNNSIMSFKTKMALKEEAEKNLKEWNALPNLPAEENKDDLIYQEYLDNGFPQEFIDICKVLDINLNCIDGFFQDDVVTQVYDDYEANYSIMVSCPKDGAKGDIKLNLYKNKSEYPISLDGNIIDNINAILD